MGRAQLDRPLKILLTEILKNVWENEIPQGEVTSYQWLKKYYLLVKGCKLKIFNTHKGIHLTKCFIHINAYQQLLSEFLRLDYHYLHLLMYVSNISVIAMLPNS